MWRRRLRSSVDRAHISNDFLEWVSNMPYVVERSDGSSSPVRVFDIDCEPLGQRRRWLILDFAPDSPTPSGISLLLPRSLAERAARAGWGHRYTHKLLAGGVADRSTRVVLRVDARAERRQIESVVMESYNALINWT
jgi:hypothetical protein